MDIGLQRKRLGKAAVAIRSADYRRALRLGVLPAVEHQAVLERLSPLGAVLDIGANVGQFALVARHTSPDAQITSFEPLPRALERLRSVFRGDPHHAVVAVACSRTAGTATLHVTEADDSSSLLPVAPRQVEEFPDTRNVGAVEVATAPLDAVLPDGALTDRPVLLKIDTQGAELDVLEGAVQTLGSIDHVLVEVSFVELYEGQATATEVTSFLTRAGFGLTAAYDVKSSRLTGEPLQADLLFSRAR